MKKNTLLLIIVLLACTPLVQPVFAQGKSEKVAAVFLFKLSNYVTWPHHQGAELMICTYGGDPFKGILEKLIKLQKNAPQVKHINFGNSLNGCDLTYLPSVKSLSSVNGAVLTVSHDYGFAKNGGMIEMRETPQRMKFIVNLKAVEEAKLKMSARFLEIADVIR